MAKIDLVINTLYLEHLGMDAAPMTQETQGAQNTFDGLLQKVRDLDRPLYFDLDGAFGDLLDLLAREYYRRGFEDAWSLKEELRTKAS
ncbi:MAG: hypothetical protein RIN56_03145 [Sporomusaceae bacterium]|nr:hypothetical protein [Sporomusaceae bacterium]